MNLQLCLPTALFLSYIALFSITFYRNPSLSLRLLYTHVYLAVSVSLTVYACMYVQAYVCGHVRAAKSPT